MNTGSEAAELVVEYAETLDVSEDTAAQAADLAETVELESTVNGPSKHIAAAVLYWRCLLANEKRTQHELADVAGCSWATISRMYEDVAEVDGFDVKERHRNTPDTKSETVCEVGVFGRLKEVFCK